MLDLEGNKLTDVPQGVFEDLANLVALNLRSNNLGGALFLDEFFHTDRRRRRKNLLPTGAKYEKQQQTLNFAVLKNLEQLDLAQNELHDLPRAGFSAMANLKELRLDANRLTSVGEYMCMYSSHIFLFFTPISFRAPLIAVAR